MNHAFAKSTVDADRLSSIKVLDKGGHKTAADGMCAMEAVAHLAGEPWSDQPDCACPVIAAFLRGWNDNLADGRRTDLLRPLLPRIVGTRRREAEPIRSIMAADWLVRACAPAWTRLAGAGQAAQALEGLPDFVGAPAVAASEPTLIAAHRRIHDLRERQWVTWRPGDGPPASPGNEGRAKAADDAMRATRLDAERLARACGADAARAAAIVGDGMMALARLMAEAMSLVLDAAHVAAAVDHGAAQHTRAKLQMSAVALIVRMVEAAR